MWLDFTMSKDRNILEHSFDFKKVPGLLSIKDRQSRYVSMTEDLANFVGWKNSYAGLEKTDYELPCKASESADIFIKQDKEVIDSGLKLSLICIDIYPTGWHMLLGNKIPIKNDDNFVTGFFLNCLDVSDLSEFNTYLWLQHIDSKILGHTKTPICYILSSEQKKIKLTEKQECCLFLMLRGKTIKEIAKVLKLSPRTIESHIEAIKFKFKCEKKSDIIEKALAHGYLNSIPNYIRLNEFDKIVRIL